jgi:hypothetical protein
VLISYLFLIAGGISTTERWVWSENQMEARVCLSSVRYSMVQDQVRSRDLLTHPIAAVFTFPHFPHVPIFRLSPVFILSPPSSPPGAPSIPPPRLRLSPSAPNIPRIPHPSSPQSRANPPSLVVRKFPWDGFILIHPLASSLVG